jgi:hypothetical protein
VAAGIGIIFLMVIPALWFMLILMCVGIPLVEVLTFCADLTGHHLHCGHHHLSCTGLHTTFPKLHLQVTGTVHCQCDRCHSKPNYHHGNESCVWEVGLPAYHLG